MKKALLQGCRPAGEQKMARHGAEGALQGNGCPNGASSPLSPSRIPRPATTPPSFRRASSLRLKGERGFGGQLRSPDYHRAHNEDLFPAINENDAPLAYPIRRSNSSLSLTPARGRSGRLSRGPEDCSDAESVGSNYSTASACDHASFALNGTTWSGRSQRYIVHCSSHAAADSDEYLTPTQRAARQLRRFQSLLREARKEIEEKEREIFRLTKEVVELRLYKASLNSPDEKTDSSETTTVRENHPADDESAPASLLASPRTPDKRDSSLVDSGHFDDGSLRGPLLALADESCASSLATRDQPSPPVRLVDHYESRIEEMHRRHVDELQALKQSHNDKVEGLLNQIVALNSSYGEARPSLEAAEARNKELELQADALRNELAEQKALLADQEERNKQMYLKMYSQGQQAARMEQADQVMVLDPSPRSPSKISVAELLQQLTVTQAELENVKAMYRRIVELRNSQGALDPEITLQFLKSAIYYFLTDKENLHGHLNAIESILGFTELEKLNIDRIYRPARK